jgi:glycosyltransferase involved in cell wall biosynthesis
MKILHISTGFPLSYPGGITNYVRALAKAQANLGYEVHVLARPEKHAAHLNKIKVEGYISSRVIPFSLKIVDKDPTTDQVANLLSKEHFDIVHFHMALDFPMQFLRDFASFGVPYVVSLHDYFYICPRIFMMNVEMDVCREVDVQKCQLCVGRLDQINLFRRAARKLGVVLPRIPSSRPKQRLEAMRAFLQKAALLLPVSTRTAEIYKKIVPGANFVVEQIGNESALMNPMAKKPSNKIRLTILGTLNKMKGAGVLEELIKSVRRQDIEFHFYGRVSGDHEKRLCRYGLICHGSYVPEDLPAILAKTDVGLVLPIWEDNGPQVAMEFINNRIPVLGTRRGGVPDIVSEESGFLFDPDDPSGMKLALTWLEDLCSTKIKEISARIQRLKTPAQHAARIATLYNKVLESASVIDHRG